MDFAKDVSLKGYTDEILLNEVDGMTDLLYEKQGSYLQGKEEGLAEGRVEGRRESKFKYAQMMVDNGILTPEKAAELFEVPAKDILPQKR